MLPTQGIVEVDGQGTVIAGTLAVPPRRCEATVAEPPRLSAGSGTPPLRLRAVTGAELSGGAARSPEHDVSAWVAIDGEFVVSKVNVD
jgi:hypothetical protein